MILRFAAFLVTLLPTVALAAASVQSEQLIPLGYCQLTSLSQAATLKSCANGVPATAQVIIVVPEAQDVRWRDDGTHPTATVGMPVAVGVALVYQGELNAIEFIQQAASAKLNVTFYKYLR